MSTGLSTLDTSVHKTNQWLGELTESLHLENREQSFACLRAVLHAVRDRVTVEQSAHLAAQLPLVLRGVFFEGWQPSKVPDKQIKNDQDFLERVQSELGPNQDFVGRANEVAQRVLSTLGEHVSAGEREKLKSNLPDPVVRRLWPN